MKNKPIKILMITADPVGGLRKHILDIAFNINRENFELSFSADFAKADKGFEENLEKLRKICDGRLYGLTVPKSPALVDIVNIFKLIRLVRRQRFDIVHGHAAKGGLYARLVSLFTGVPSVYTPHGGSLHNCYGFFQRNLYRGIESILSGATNKFVFESGYSANEFLSRVKRLPEKQYVINHNGVEVADDKAAQPFSSPGIRLCAFGTLRPIKGHDVLLDAMALLQEKGLSVTLDLYGQGESRVALEEQADRLGISVNFMGEVPDGVKKMCEYDILVQPSRFESFGYVLLEAMSVGLPVIASNVGGMVEIIEHGETGFLFESGSSPALAIALGYLIQNPDVPANMALKARGELDKRFSVNAMVCTLEGVYRSLFQK